MSKKRTSIAKEETNLRGTQMTYRNFKKRVLKDLLPSEAWASEHTQRCVAIVNFIDDVPWFLRQSVWRLMNERDESIRDDLSKAYSVLTYFVMLDEIERVNGNE